MNCTSYRGATLLDTGPLVAWFDLGDQDHRGQYRLFRTTEVPPWPSTRSLIGSPHPALNTDRWFYGVFQSAPDLIRWLAEPSAGLNASLGAVPTELDRQYRFSAPELKAGSHRLEIGRAHV